MPLRNARAVTFRPQGVSDAVDGSSAFPGALTAAADLIPSMHTKNVWVPRPAAFPYLDFGRPVTGEELLIIGNKIYGFVTSARFPAHSEPFAYNIETRAFIPISGVTVGNTPVSAPATGDWTPPTSAVVGAYILFTHPGFALPNAFGWLDMTGLHDTATGSTGFSIFTAVWGEGVWGASKWAVVNVGGGHIIGGLSKNINLAGWRPGMIITDSAGVIPPGTRITDISVDGLSLALSQSATAGVPNDTFTVLGGTPDAPLWAAGNTAINHLIDVPVAVTQFNGRAWFAVGLATPFTDALNPLVMTNASQVLTYDNGLDVTAFGAIPLATQLGGIIQSLLAFQGDNAIQQIQGDQATQNLSKNLLSEIGTLAPNAIVSTPVGVLFIAPDGLRIVSQQGQVGDPIGANGDGVALPFINAVYPTRMCASYNEDVFRLSVTYNRTESGSPISAVMSAEFWFHLKQKAWSGPHSFPAALLAPLDMGATRHGHLMFPLLADGGIWFSNTRPLINAGYIENGLPMNWVYETTLLPDTESMFMNAVNETTVMLSIAPTGMANVVFKADDGVLLDHVQLNGFAPRAGVWGAAVWGEGRWGGPAVAGSLWGSAIWGQSVWGDGIGPAVITQRLVPWDHELVFKQGQLVVSGRSGPQVAIGNVRLRYQQTGYTLTDLQSGVSS
jgi:hypothetical protein